VSAGIDQLLEIMRRLRAPVGGCPWDRAQSFASIAPYTIEEAYELADAIASGEPGPIRDELGDLLFQVVFHAELAAERGWFDFEAVTTAIGEKLRRRHPHVFGTAPAGDPAALAQSWEAIKAAERAGRADSSRLAEVARALPALSRAAKLGARAAGAGFDFSEARAARAKLDEELAELEAELAADPTGRDPRIAEEYGDVLFSVVNIGRKLGLDAERCLRAANDKFEGRFRRMERLALERGLELGALAAAEWDTLWREVK
jgi:MazG family protein